MSASPQSAPPRRDVIYPHRSFRALRFDPMGVLLAFVLAILLSLTVLVEGQSLLDLHQSLTGFFTSLAGVPHQADPRRTDIFPGHFTAAVPPITVPYSADVPDLNKFPALIAAALLLAVSRHNTITRGFFYFLFVLLTAGVVALTLFPQLHANAETVTQVWLRSALPIWLLMPWLASFLFLAANPGWRHGIFWTLGLMLHLFWTSALRQAFLLAVLHHTGILFYPVLWFLTGFLFDVLILLVFYSLSLHGATRGLWGQREEVLA